MRRSIPAGAWRALPGQALLAALLAAGPAPAQDWGDTPYVQTPQNVVEKMLEIARVGPGDYVIDLGSGDGRMVITAAKKYGARGFGVDLDRKLVALSNRNAARAGVAGRAVFYQRDLHATDVSRATVLTLYLLPEVNLMIRGKLLSTLRPGTRIVSHDYDMGEWAPDLALEMDAPGKSVGIGQRSKVFYWVVPAVASGRWRWRLPLEGAAREFDLSLEQLFQKLEGTLTVDGQAAKLAGASLTGSRIRLAVEAGEERYEFEGRIIAHAIEGSARVKGKEGTRQANWSAVRTELREPRHAGLAAPRFDPDHPR
ncbi:MAG TPA: methyltransferase domain-containing protein [Burkholderiales bacterium]|nr:methyltransferase domain-containing protein [Burkholderiales bacterium]